MIFVLTLYLVPPGLNFIAESGKALELGVGSAGIFVEVHEYGLCASHTTVYLVLPGIEFPLFMSAYGFI